MTHSTCMKEVAQKHKSPIDAWRLRGSCVHHCGEVGFRCEVKLGQIVGMSKLNFNLNLFRRTPYDSRGRSGCLEENETDTRISKAGMAVIDGCRELTSAPKGCKMGQVQAVPHDGSERSPTPNRAGDKVDKTNQRTLADSVTERYWINAVRHGAREGSASSQSEFSGLRTVSAGRAIGSRYEHPLYSRLDLVRGSPEMVVG